SEFLRGTAALAALASAHDRGDLISAAARAGKRLEGERVAWATPLGQILRAAARAAEGDRSPSVTALLEEAARGAAATGMQGYALAARRALGVLRGGLEGAEIVYEAEAELARRGVKETARFANMLLPGFGG